MKQPMASDRERWNQKYLAGEAKSADETIAWTLRYRDTHDLRFDLITSSVSSPASTSPLFHSYSRPAACSSARA